MQNGAEKVSLLDAQKHVSFVLLRGTVLQRCHKSKCRISNDFLETLLSFWMRFSSNLGSLLGSKIGSVSIPD